MVEVLKEKQQHDEVRAALKALTVPLAICPSCNYLKKLTVFTNKKGYFVGRGCSCGPDEILSDTYPTFGQAKLDLSTGSWRS